MLNIPREILYIIITFLDKDGVKNLDSSFLVSKILSPEIIYVLTNHIFKFRVCKWTHFRKIKSIQQNCFYTDIKMVSEACKNHTISGNYLLKKKVSISDSDCVYIDIDNDNITILHIDLFQIINTQLRLIKGLNIKKITLVCVGNINYDVFLDIVDRCPKLAYIVLIKSCEIFDEIFLKSLVANDNVKLAVKNTTVI